MRRILFIAPVSLKNPIRGTPLRIYNFLVEIKKAHELWVCAFDLKESSGIPFIPYPAARGLKKLRYVRDVIKRHGIELVLTATETAIKLPILLKLLTGVKIAIDVHGLMHEELLFSGAVSRFRAWWLGLKTKFLLRFYDVAFVVADKLGEYYAPYTRRSEVIYGGAHLEEFPYLYEANSDRPFTMSYMGNARGYQGLDQLLEAAGRIKAKNLFPFRLKLVLSDETEESFREKLASFNLREEAELYFNVSHERVNEVIAGSDTLVIPRPSVVMTEYAYPSKLPENLATGIPVILTKVGPVGPLLEGTDTCIIIEPNDIAQRLLGALVRLSRLSAAEREAMGRRARAFVYAHLTWTKLGEKINSILEEL